MSEPVRVGDLLAETLADLRKRQASSAELRVRRETLGAQVKTAPRADRANDQLIPQGLAQRLEGTPN